MLKRNPLFSEGAVKEEEVVWLQPHRKPEGLASRAFGSSRQFYIYSIV